MFDCGIDGEEKFKDSDGKASGKKMVAQLKNAGQCPRTHKDDGREAFDVTNERHLQYLTRPLAILKMALPVLRCWLGVSAGEPQFARRMRRKVLSPWM